MKTLLTIGKTYQCPRCGSKYLTERVEGGSYTRPLDEKEVCGFWCEASVKAWQQDCEGCHGFFPHEQLAYVEREFDAILFCNSCEQMHYRMEEFAEVLREQRVERGA